MAIIIDLDNCISDDQWRLKFIEKDERHLTRKYSRYHLASVDDKPANLGMLLPDEVKFILTSRPEGYREITTTWLKKYNIDYSWLLMRPSGNVMKSVDLKKGMLRDLVKRKIIIKQDITCAYDDRQDVVDMYKEEGLNAERLFITERSCNENPSAATILEEMATTFRERNKEYGDNYKMVGPIMKVLFPEGAKTDLLSADQFHLFELIIIKLSRYAISDLKHVDSIHDVGVYAAMCEAVNNEII